MNTNFVKKVFLNVNENDIILRDNPNRKRLVRFIYKRVSNYSTTNLMKNFISSFIESGYFIDIMNESSEISAKDNYVIRVIQNMFLGTTIEQIIDIIKSIKETELRNEVDDGIFININLTKNYNFNDFNLYTISIENINNYQDYIQVNQFINIFFKLYQSLVLKRDEIIPTIRNTYGIHILKIL